MIIKKLFLACVIVSMGSLAAQSNDFLNMPPSALFIAQESGEGVQNDTDGTLDDVLPKSTHWKRGPRGHRGHKGHKGHKGKKGSEGSTGTSGSAGAVGATGATGAAGTIGAVGSTGATGATGAVGSSAIIPFASGTTPAVMTTVAGGLSSTGAIVGFGSSSSLVDVSTGTIDLTDTSIGNYAFSMPRDGTITSLAAYFNTTVALSLVGTTVTVHAQVYQSATPDNLFTPILGASVDLTPALTGVLAINTVSNGLVNGLSIPVTAQTRLLVVFSITASGVTLVQTVTGFASAGLSID